MRNTKRKFLRRPKANQEYGGVLHPGDIKTDKCKRERYERLCARIDACMKQLMEAR